MNDTEHALTHSGKMAPKVPLPRAVLLMPLDMLATAGGSRARKCLVITALLIAAAAGIALIVWWHSPKPGAAMSTAPATVGDVDDTVLATGTLRPVRLVPIGAQASGRILSLKVAVGEAVKKGHLIAQIDSMTQQNALRTKQAMLAQRRAERDEKEALLTARYLPALGRQRTMVSQNASSRADYEEAEADVKTTRAQIAQLDAQIAAAEVDVATAETDLGYTRITAPIGGTVLAIVAQEGQTVNAVQSAPTIVILGQLDTMEIQAQISEADILKVKPGQPVTFTVLGAPDRRYEAKLEQIEPAPDSIRSDPSVSSTASQSASAASGSGSGSGSSASSQAIYYNGIFHVPNPDGRLLSYMTAEVRILTNKAAGVLTIPSSALGRREADGRYVVRVLETGDQTTERNVEIGLNNNTLAEVRSGLKEGERVVTVVPPSDKLRVWIRGGL